MRIVSNKNFVTSNNKNDWVFISVALCPYTWRTPLVKNQAAAKIEAVTLAAAAERYMR
jgi:hypothetical protein